MPTIRKLLRDGTEQLRQAGVDSASLDARLLLQYVLEMRHEELLRHHTQLVGKGKALDYKKLLLRRMEREPLACITGHKEFWSLEFRTTQDTLDPRPDSETLIETALRLCEPATILDVGTGTGCLLLTLLHEYSQARGTGVDISPAALRVAESNAKRLGLQERVHFLHSDWLAGVDGQFDLIISNPPYIPSSDIDGLEPEVRDYDPMGALDGGADGLDAYRALIPQAAARLALGGWLLLEIGQGQQGDVTNVVTDAGLEVREQVKDLAGIVRCIAASKRE